MSSAVDRLPQLPATATPDQHDGESLRVSQHGFHVGYARNVRELERWVDLADLEKVGPLMLAA